MTEEYGGRNGWKNGGEIWANYFKRLPFNPNRGSLLSVLIVFPVKSCWAAACGPNKKSQAVEPNKKGVKVDARDR